MMLAAEKTSETAQRLSQIMATLRENPTVEGAVLSTEDGLAIDAATSLAMQMAAVAGFMSAATHQSLVMLGLKESYEVVIREKAGCFLVCRPFRAGDSQLILTVVFKKKATYRNLLRQTIRAIQKTVKK